MNGESPIFDFGGLDGLTPPNLSQTEFLAEKMTRLSVFHGYIGVFIVAFVVTVFITPILRRLAIANGVIDHPDGVRKEHKLPVAYLGGVAIYLGLLSAIGFSFFAPAGMIDVHPSEVRQVPAPFSILLGMTLIMLIGLLDDMVGISPRIKISGQLLAAAALAMDDVGVKVAAGVLTPLARLLHLNESLLYTITLPIPVPFIGGQIQFDVIYWVGTAIIAAFILGACNASNLVDGLDGLLPGVTAIAAVAMLIIALGLAIDSDGPLDGARVILALAILGACLGFLPHNFRPATIFLGDSGSMLLGFMTVVVILTFGDTGRTPLVVAGLLIYAVPMIDTTLAIVRRRMAGIPLSEADDQHIHHLLKRSVGVTCAVFILYGISAIFGVLGVLVSLGRARVSYAIAMVLAAFIGVTAVKIAHLKMFEEQAKAIAESRARQAQADRTTRLGKRPTPTASTASEDPNLGRQPAHTPR